ncbi:unnamed protein product, partial [Staurois parvus]
KAELHPKGEVPLYELLPCSPLRICTFGERVPKFDRYPLPLPIRSPRKRKVSSLPP